MVSTRFTTSILLFNSIYYHPQALIPMVGAVREAGTSVLLEDVAGAPPTSMPPAPA
jgi:hypothetical protein